MKNIFNKKLIDKIFDLGLLAKFFIGFFEILGGLVFWISGQVLLNNFLIFLAQQEVSDDADDFIVMRLTKLANSLSVGTHIFAISYLIFHGVINIFLAIALLKNKIWAYPWAITGFSIFIIYQVFRYSHTHSLLLLLLTIFDIFIVLVIFLEYNNKRKKSNEK